MSGEETLAFPCGSGDLRDPCGLTKRELFAAMAMQGLVLYRSPEGQQPPEGIIAAWAVAQADALLAALSQTEGADTKGPEGQ